MAYSKNEVRDIREAGKVDSDLDELERPIALVIDDEPGIGRLIDRSLHDSAKVLQLFEVPATGELDLTGVDLVFLDYKMPGRSGLDVLKEIRSSGNSVPVIFMTGFGGSEVAKTALKAGATEYLSKPFEPILLKRLVNRLSRANEIDQTEKAHRDNPRLFRGEDADGQTFHAHLKVFDSRLAILSSKTDPGLQPGDEVTNAEVVFGNSRLEFSLATVISVQVEESQTYLSLRIPGGWVVEEKAVKPQASFACRHSETGSRERESIPGDLRLAAIDLAEVFQEVKDDVDDFESSLLQYSPEERIRFEDEFTHQAKDVFFRQLTGAVSKFESAAEAACEAGLKDAFKGFSRRVLYPHVLGSPFMSRIVERPIGVPGDFDMLGQILGKRFRGDSLYGRIINEWILSNPATDAYRHRVRLLEDQTRAMINKKSAVGKETSILSMASGVAYEIQRYCRNPISGGEVNFTMVDFSADTLEEGRSQFAEQGPVAKGITLNFEQSSVIDLANQSRTGKASSGEQIGFVPDRSYDVVYCAGLYDYLSDRMVTSVTRYLNTLLAEGGTLVLSNYTTENPFAHFMDIVLDWELIYRSQDLFRNLMTKALGEESFDLVTDNHGVEVYCVKKAFE